MPGQTDGATMDSSDSTDSSEDERLGGDEDDRDELDDEDDERAEQEVDEEPLNSDDDVSDEEVNKLFRLGKTLRRGEFARLWPTFPGITYIAIYFLLLLPLLLVIFLTTNRSPRCRRSTTLSCVSTTKSPAAGTDGSSTSRTAS